MRGGLGPLAVTLVAVGLFVAVLPDRGLAQTTLDTFCSTTGVTDATGDADNDGLTNSEECNGLNTGAGQASAPVFVPRCIGTEAIGSTARNGCLDPRPLCILNPVTGRLPDNCADGTPDGFVCLVRTTPSLIPADPFRFVYKPSAQGGLGIAVHEVSCSALGPNREVTTTQKAQKGQENASTTPGDFGVATVGTPNHPQAGCTIWTARIKQWTIKTQGADNPAVYQDLTRHIAAHECFGHGVTLAKVPDPSVIGNHHPASAKVMMSQYVTYKKTTILTPTSYTPTADPENYLLKEVQ
jgi:hypothetical protein